MKKLMTLALLMLMTFMAHAQMLNPVKFSSQLKLNGTAEGEIIFSGKIDKGWHVYSTGLGNDGPISATFNVNKLEGVQLVGKMKPMGHEISAYDNIFGMKLRYFEGSVRFVQKVKFTKPNYVIDAYLTYGACNDQNCMPPTDVTIKKSGKSPATDQADKDAAADDQTAADAQQEQAAATQNPAGDSAAGESCPGSLPPGGPDAARESPPAPCGPTAPAGRSVPRLG